LPLQLLLHFLQVINCWYTAVMAVWGWRGDDQ
jgi:hypothetical protein